MSDQETLSSEGGIGIEFSAPSPYDLPEKLRVEAQDPEEEKSEESPTEDTPEEPAEEAADDPLAEEEPEEEKVGPSEEEMLESIEKSPGVQWRKYLRPVLKIIKDTKLKVPIELHNSYTVGMDDDTSLGFHIVGIVHFIDEVPADVAAQLKGETLRYDAFVTPDGNLGDVDLLYPTLQAPYEPTFRINRNVERL